MLPENVFRMRIPSDVRLKTKYVLELENEIRPLTLSKGLFSYAGRTLNAKYGCDPHSMFTLNAISMINERPSKSSERTAKCLRKDTFMLSDLTSNPKVPEKVIFSESK